jgi:hypothetical protein
MAVHQPHRSRSAECPKWTGIASTERQFWAVTASAQQPPRTPTWKSVAVTNGTLDVEALLDSVNRLREGGQSPAAVLTATGVNDVGDEELREAVHSVLEVRADLVALWQGWSWDKRWTPSPYLDGLEVGHYDGGKRNVRNHPTAARACADFVLTEVRWIVERRVVS